MIGRFFVCYLQPLFANPKRRTTVLIDISSIDNSNTTLKEG